MAINVSLIISVLLSCLVATGCGHVSFTSLQKTLIVTATPQPGQVLKAGEDNITGTWSLDTTLPTGTDSAYKTVKIKLCYAPISQHDRPRRKTVEDLSKDSTRQHKIVAKPYNRSNNNFTWTVQKDVPTATYFIRAYAHNSADEELAYGQTTDSQKATNLFEVQGITGHHMSLDVATGFFSAFSILSLFGFFFIEKRKAKIYKPN